MFTYKRRVKFYETDGMRVVHHVNYLRYLKKRESSTCAQAGLT